MRARWSIARSSTCAVMITRFRRTFASVSWVEVPSLLFQLDELMTYVDFVSVGSNDLFQFFCAVDRGNTRVAERFDTLNVAFLRALKSIADSANKNHVPVTLCGELAGRPLEAMALIGLGYRDHLHVSGGSRTGQGHAEDA